MIQDKDSTYDKKLELNENLYKSFLENIDTIKTVIDESQETYDRTNDKRIKEISGRTVNTAKKYLKELENKKPRVAKQYEETKTRLESLK
ncbi:MAG: hypothetical protein MRJ93_02710 [Nitrososphaeraceae archaeon]|nr:hypothetical protein [Nitrososphaeraceae archaeon]